MIDVSRHPGQVRRAVCGPQAARRALDFRVNGERLCRQPHARAAGGYRSAAGAHRAGDRSQYRGDLWRRQGRVRTGDRSGRADLPGRTDCRSGGPDRALHLLAGTARSRRRGARRCNAGRSRSSSSTCAISPSGSCAPRKPAWPGIRCDRAIDHARPLGHRVRAAAGRPARSPGSTARSWSAGHQALVRPALAADVAPAAGVCGLRHARHAGRRANAGLTVRARCGDRARYFALDAQRRRTGHGSHRR